MSEILPTVKVKHKKYGIEMIINESDFDKEIHELFDEKAKKKAKKVEIEEDEEAKLKALMGEK